jgi:glycosyltransferase involved in cell wall biosynthesis
MRPTRKLLSIAHSYAVALNRRLAHEMAKVGGRCWEVTAIAPKFFHGQCDLRSVELQALSDEACRLEAIPAHLTRRVHLFFYGARLRTVLREGWDLVHCWEEPYVVAGLQIARWTPAHVPLVYATFQNLPKRYPPPFNWIERLTMRRAAGWIAFGQTIAATLITRASYRDKPMRTIPLGVDIDRFRPDAAAGRDVRRALKWNAAGPPVVGFLGRFVAEKGIELLMRVLDQMATPWRALFVGAGPMEGRLRTWAGAYGDRVRICTDVAHDAVPAYLNAMDVLCAPSQTTKHWREQFGRMLIEAFACGVPVIGSDSGEIPYVVGDAGRIVAEADELAWGAALRELLGDSALRRELSQRGRARAEAQYAWPLIAHRHLKFFDAILDGGQDATQWG